jgi:hypothetical protein
MSTNKEATRKKMEEGLWSGQCAICNFVKNVMSI